MTLRTGYLVGVLAILGTASGCIAPGYDGVKLAREAGPKCEVPLEDRNEVYVFVVGGNNPLEMLATDRFREGISAGGYAKVAAGPSVYSWWMMGEMRRIHKEDPNAVFAIAGLDTSASAGAKLCEKAVAEHIPVRGLVLVDTANKAGPPSGIHTLLVSSNTGVLGNGAVEPLVIAAPGTLGLAAEIRTIEQTVRLLNEVAIGNSSPPPAPPTTDWAYPFAADVLVNFEPHPESDWSYLFDQPGGITRAIDEPLPLQIPVGNGNTARR